MSNVICFPGVTVAKGDADKLLEEAKGKLDRVILIGVTNEDMDYRAASFSDVAEIVWLIERFKHYLNVVADGA